MTAETPPLADHRLRLTKDGFYRSTIRVPPRSSPPSIGASNAGRSLAYNETFSRAGMFLTFLSASPIIVGFLVASDRFADAVIPIVILLGPPTSSVILPPWADDGGRDGRLDQLRALRRPRSVIAIGLGASLGLALGHCVGAFFAGFIGFNAWGYRTWTRTSLFDDPMFPSPPDEPPES